MDSQELKARLEEIWREGPLIDPSRRVRWRVDYANRVVGEGVGAPVNYTSKETRRRRKGLAMYNPSLHAKVRAEANVTPWWVVWPERLIDMARLAGGVVCKPRKPIPSNWVDHDWDAQGQHIVRLSKQGWAALAEANKHLNGETENVAAE